MSEQAQILDKMQEIVMSILKNGSATIEEADMIDELEALLHKQKCFTDIGHPEYACQGEEIAGLFFSENYNEAINKMYESGITANDFFGFLDYYYDEDEDRERFAKLFTNAFISDVNKAYELKCESN